MSNSKNDTILQRPELLLNERDLQDLPVAAQIQQVLSLLIATSKNNRVQVRANPNGAIWAVAPVLQDVIMFTATQVNDTQNGNDIPCTSVICMGYPDNVSKVWVRPHATASTSNGWPLDANDVVQFTLENLNQLYMLIVADTEKLIVGYTR